MNLKGILGFGKGRVVEKVGEEVRYIDEDLSVEEISEKIDKMRLDEAKEYVSKLSEDKKINQLVHSAIKKYESLGELNKKCVSEHGVDLQTKYGLGIHKF